MSGCVRLGSRLPENGTKQTTSQQHLSLPPNVNGRQRGTLTVRLSAVRWSSKSFPAVELSVQWWGQRGERILRWEQGKLKGGGSGLEYRILTSEELFRKYLRAAEPLQGRLVSARTSSLIGTVQVPVPGRLVNFRAGSGQEVTTVSSVGEIFSGRRFGLGEVELEFGLRFDEALREKENRKVGPMVVSVKRPVPVVMQPERDVGQLAVKGVPVPLHETKQVKTFRSLDNRSQSKVLSYLSGRLSDEDEDATLNEICSISPAESMLEALSKFDAAPRKTDYLRVVDSARFHLESLKFTKAGLKELFHKSKLVSLADVGFLVKVKMPSQSTRGEKVRFGSVSVSDCGEVKFDGKATVKLAIPKKVEDFQFEFLIYLALGPVFHQRSTTGRQIFLGSSVIKLEELVGNRFACHKKCPVRLVSDDILLGMLTVRLELGARGLHFGPELIDALQVDKENVSVRSSSSSESGDFTAAPRCWGAYNHPPRHHFHCRPMTCSQDERTSSGEGAKPTVQQATPQGTSGSAPVQKTALQGEGSESKPQSMDTQERPKSPPKNALHGVLHLGQLKEAPELESGGYFLVAHGFWSTDGEDPILTTELSQNESSFDYLITFPVLPDGRFFERTRNQHMLVELWQKAPGTAEKLVGVTRLPLHQFYIAFRDAQLAEHLARAKLPVVSIDGWSGIGSPLAAEPCGQVQAVLAVRTENQIEYFKLSRGLDQHHSGDAPMAGRRPEVPQVDKSTAETQTTNRPASGSDSSSYQPINTTPSSAGKQQSEVANMLSAFIENLAQRLPISSERSTAPCYDQNFAEARAPTNVATPPSLPSPHSQANKPEMRKTSDLLENLQRALAQKPPAGFTTPNLLTAPSASPSEERAPQPLPKPDPEPPKPAQTSPQEKLFSVTIEIEQAVNLPKLNVSKKYGKRNKNKSGGQRIELEPSAYVTFEGYNLAPGTPNTVKSHEGIVYTTAVIETSCNPAWSKKFAVQLPVDLMTNDEKRFILKVWRKAVSAGDAAKPQSQRMQQPAPMEDAVVGFTAVDLSVLLNGMPCIMGWYNIMDFSGRCNGQIKVNIQPQENVTIYKDDGANFQIPLSIDVDCGGIDATGNTSLSRALKRKFTELEEISQRLKARLFDVTGSDDNDPDDEFEQDLNTEADEEEDEEWVDPLGDTSSGQKRNSQHPNGESAPTLTTNTSSYSYTMSSDRRVPERSLTGCSDRSTVQQSTTSAESVAEGQLQLEELLKKHDLDTLINPKLLKSLINPSVMSTSESTASPSRGNPYENLLQEETGSGAGTSADDADMSEDSPRAVTSDKVKLISSALQRTTISDDPVTGVTTTTTTTTGEGSGGDQQKREAPEGEPMTVNDK
uniref:C2 domain-containing protein n=1 Tax=Culex tarsalis TaxID=7177 RepID=A0A1Q3F7W3_CULTA